MKECPLFSSYNLYTVHLPQVVGAVHQGAHPTEGPAEQTKFRGRQPSARPRAGGLPSGLAGAPGGGQEEAGGGSGEREAQLRPGRLAQLRRGRDCRLPDLGGSVSIYSIYVLDLCTVSYCRSYQCMYCLPTVYLLSTSRWGISLPRPTRARWELEC